MKQVTNLLDLLARLALLAVGGFFFRELTYHGKAWWQRESAVTAQPPRSAKSGSGGDDALQSAASLKTYGVLAQQDGASGGDDAVAAPSSGPSSSLDHINATDAGAANHFLHRRLSLKTSQVFAFEVPPRAIHPELRGTFRSIATRPDPGSSPFVEILLLNDQEFTRFINNRPVTATFTSNGSSRGDIHWELNAPVGNPQKYYLVFRNSPEGQGSSIVDADFTASFE